MPPTRLSKRDNQFSAGVFFATAVSAMDPDPETFARCMTMPRKKATVDTRYDNRIAHELLEVISAIIDSEGWGEIRTDTPGGAAMALLAGGAYPQRGDAPLHLAAPPNSALGAAALIEVGADLNAENADGRLSLQLAQEHGQGSEITRILSGVAALPTTEERRAFSRKWIDAEREGDGALQQAWNELAPSSRLM